MSNKGDDGAHSVVTSPKVSFPCLHNSKQIFYLHPERVFQKSSVFSDLKLHLCADKKAKNSKKATIVSFLMVTRMRVQHGKFRNMHALFLQNFP